MSMSKRKQSPWGFDWGMCQKNPTIVKLELQRKNGNHAEKLLNVAI